MFIYFNKMDINIKNITTIPSPNELINEFNLDSDDVLFIEQSRSTIKDILVDNNKKLLVIIGPCSIHNIDSALEYANYIKLFQAQNPNLFIVMRVYFEKPRSRHGWKGFIYDPDLDETYNINKGLRLARELLVKLTKLRIPIGCEFLDTISPQYLSDTVSWGAIGARTSESQIHRQLASGLSMPIGFKNLTDGDYKKAIDGILSSKYPHHFLGIDYDGKACHVTTKGNKYSHLILRGGLEPNYYQKDMEEITNTLIKENIHTGLIIDCSHGNSQKEYLKQVLVASSITRLLTLNKYPIKGVMIESNIVGGNQKLTKDISSLKYGISITDGCIDIGVSNIVLSILNSNQSIKEYTNLNDVRSYLQLFENDIIRVLNNDTINNNYLITDNVTSPDLIINYDNELFSITNDPVLLCLLHKRLGISELIANIKYYNNTYNFLLKNNDYYKLVTDRGIETNILYRVDNYYPNSPINSNEHDDNAQLFIKIMELSKRIQVKYMEEFIPTQKIGYLGNKATFSYEVINKNFNGIHVGCSNINDLYSKLELNIVDFVLIPTYNSLIGVVFIPKYTVIGSIDHKIELSLFCNVNTVNVNTVNVNTVNVNTVNVNTVKTLYIQEVVLKECIQYVNTKLKNINIVICDTTEEGCIKCIQDTNSMTIASRYNNCNFLKLVEDNIVDHNITTFSIIKK